METEKVFYYMVEQGRLYGYNMDSILEIPNSSGTTCFGIAVQCSQKISKYIIGRDIQVNSITTDMMVPEFKYPGPGFPGISGIPGINPHVIAYT